MKHFGLLGEHLSHSISPQIHRYVYENLNIDADYKLVEFPKEELESTVHKLAVKNFSGVNVTIPYKKDVVPLLDDIDDLAKTIGSINTIDIDQGRLIGYNTDYNGIKATLESYMPLESHTYLILGYGGACLPLIRCLLDHGASKIYIASRNPAKSRHDLGSITDEYTTRNDPSTIVCQGAIINNSNYMVCEDSPTSTIEFIGYESLHSIEGRIIFNTTPLGMHPHEGDSPIDKDVFKNFDIAIDLIYNPCETRFLREARRSGLGCQNGLKMLVYQALKSVEIWNKINIDPSLSDKIYKYFIEMNMIENSHGYHIKNNCIEEENKNQDPIYLIGMPGSGKTSIGQLLAHFLGFDFVDLDQYIEDTSGKTIDYIFKKEGERSFREYEEEALINTSNLKNTIISTGGGCITSEKNRLILSRSDRVFYIIRDLDTIIRDSSLKNRPLLSEDPSLIYALYRNRKKHYEEVSDQLIHNSSSLETAVFDILDRLLNKETL